MKKSKKNVLFVSVYRVSHEYGGPEEGGWWYEHYECMESYYYAYGHNRQAKLRQAIRRLNEIWRDSHYYYDIVIEKIPASHETKESPIYC